jgi:hypothetical protein
VLLRQDLAVSGSGVQQLEAVIMMLRLTHLPLRACHLAAAAAAAVCAGAAEETGRHPNAFNPWGFGVRACIGSQFALWEGKLFLCMVLRCFK